MNEGLWGRISNYYLFFLVFFDAKKNCVLAYLTPTIIRIILEKNWLRSSPKIRQFACSTQIVSSKKCKEDKNPSNFLNQLFLGCNFSQNVRMKTTYQLNINYLSTTYQLPIYYLSTTYLLPINYLSTTYQLPIHYISITYLYTTMFQDILIRERFYIGSNYICLDKE